VPESNLKMIMAAYDAAARAHLPEYDPLPSWEALPLPMRQALIYVWHDGQKHGAEEERERPH
jgi:hypothetical protein